ncbi:MAG: hypothetical protein Q8O89_00585, partial [Nanoarchaeota archaeon]|nr:hypothetical protein [Nanoarchaeota archaeon]
MEIKKTNWVNGTKRLGGKKAQITIFIIIGMMLLFSSAVYFYIQNQTLEIKVPDVVIEKVPSEFQPVSDYVTACIKSTAEAALVKVGAGGGYIDFKANSLVNPTNGNANGVSFPGVNFPGAQDIPYWYYLKGDNNGKSFSVATEQPYLAKEERRGSGSSIQEELEKFFNSEFPKCINGFEAFQGQGFFIAQGADPRSEVVIADEDVVFKVYYPLTLRKGGHETTVSKYVITTPLKLKQIYLLAADIAAAQNYYNFLEKDAVATLSAYTGTKPGDLPPFASFDIGSSKAWSKIESANKFYRIIQLNSQALQVQDSANYRGNLFVDENELLAKLRTGIYANKILPNQALLDSASFVRDYEVSFAVPEARQYFNIPNCEGAVCKGTTLSANPLGISMTSYDFTYDISYPMVIEIYDPNFVSPVNPEQKGFVFRFAMEVNVRQNEPLTSELVLRDVNMADITMFCDENKRTSGDIEFDIKDSVTLKNLEGVAISIEMPDAMCDIAVTDSNKTSFKTKLPAGFCGGTIRLTKEGYLGKEIRDVCLNPDEGRKYEIRMRPFMTVDAKVRYKMLQNMGRNNWQFNPQGSYNMREKDQAIITLTRISENVGSIVDEEYSVPLIFDAATSLDPTYYNLTLVEGKYSVDATIISGKSFRIMPDARQYKCGVRKKCTEYIPKEVQVIDAAPVGGAAITDANPWVVNGVELQNSKYVTFPMVYI